MLLRRTSLCIYIVDSIRLYRWYAVCIKRCNVQCTNTVVFQFEVVMRNYELKGIRNLLQVMERLGESGKRAHRKTPDAVVLR